MDEAVSVASLHQEWDMMYRAGLSPRRIAQLCGAARSTVQLHLKTQVHRDPSLLEDHDRNLRANDAPGPQWLSRADELARFLAIHGRPPLGTGDPAESSLAKWLTRQRALDRDGKLTPAQRRILDEMPGWRTTGRAVRDAARWREKLTGTLAFLAEHGRWPGYKHDRPDHERSLGVWLHAQRQAHRKGTLPAGKRAVLDEKLPGWSGDHRRRSAGPS